MSSKNLSLILSILLAGLILPFLLSQIDINLFFETLNIINPIYILLAFLSYFSTYLLRTWRFCILTNKEINFLDMLKIVCIHNMFNNLLPARAGELSFIYLLRKFHKKDLGEGFAILLTARVFDGLSILFLFLISAFLVGFEIGIIFYILSIPIFTLMLSFKFIKNLNLAVNSNNKFLSLLLEVLKKILDGFRSIKLGKAELTKITVLTFGIWVLQYLAIQLVLKAIFIDIDIIKIVFGSTFATVTTILPIQGIAGFGSFEGGWTLGFILTGFSKDMAIVSGLLFHFIVLFFTLVIGLVATIFLASSFNNSCRGSNCN